MDNNPATIGATGRRKRAKNKKKNQQRDDFVVPEEEPVEKIVLSEKTGLPLGVLTTPVSEIEDDTYISVNKGEARRKGELKEEKKLRKQNIKKERQLARMQKKIMKEAFNEEFERRTQEIMSDDVGGKTVFRF
jgi:protein LTV1